MNRNRNPLIVTTFSLKFIDERHFKQPTGDRESTTPSTAFYLTLYITRSYTQPSLLSSTVRRSFASNTAMQMATASSGAKDSAEFKLPVPWVTHICDAPPTVVTATKEELLNLYDQMCVVRRMETAADGLYKAKMIRGFCHLCTGQASRIPTHLHAHTHINPFYD